MGLPRGKREGCSTIGRQKNKTVVLSHSKTTNEEVIATILWQECLVYIMANGYVEKGQGFSQEKQLLIRSLAAGLFTGKSLG